MNDKYVKKEICYQFIEIDVVFLFESINGKFESLDYMVFQYQ